MMYICTHKIQQTIKQTKKMDKKMTENVQLATRIKQMRPLCSNVKYTKQMVYSVKRSDNFLIITRNK